MVVRATMMRLIRLIFREQKTRLQVDWLTHTDERILQYLDRHGPETPPSVADEIDRSIEYVSDRCRQLQLRGMLEADEGTMPVSYRVSELGAQYLAGQLEAGELEERAT